MKRHLSTVRIVLAAGGMTLGLFACGGDGDGQPNPAAAYDSNGNCSTAARSDVRQLLKNAHHAESEADRLDERSSPQDLENARQDLENLKAESQDFTGKWGQVSCTVTDENGDIIKDSHGNPMTPDLDMRQIDESLEKIKKLEEGRRDPHSHEER